MEVWVVEVEGRVDEGWEGEDWGVWLAVSERGWVGR